MFGNVRRVLMLSSLLFVAVGCQNDKDLTAGQIQSAKMDEAGRSVRRHLVAMADNALLHNMAVADTDFVPHTTELSGTGAARLDRLAPMLATYGGMLRYETYLADEVLVEQRLAHVREYLGLVGCDLDRVKIAAVMSGGRTTSAREGLSLLYDERTPVGTNREQTNAFRGPRGETGGSSGQ